MPTAYSGGNLWQTKKKYHRCDGCEECGYEGYDFKLYRALRSINLSPYLFYFDFGGFRIFGSSPETHCRIEGGIAYIDPIASTTLRTDNPEQDARNADFLRNAPKENAEHVMLVDLARNDLSRNCHHGSSKGI